MANEMVDKMLGELDRVKSILESTKITGKIPEIERDMVMSKLRVIYEFILLYQPEPFIEKKNLTSEPKNKTKTSKLVEIVDDSEISQKIESKPITEEKVIPKIQESPKNIEKVEILAEKLQPSTNFRNEALAKYANTFDIAKKFQNSPITDIFVAIGINDKFLFIKELFNNDADLYKSTVEKLNAADSFNDAIEYVDKHFTWDFDSTSVQKLLELIRRRHPVSND